MLNTAPNAWTPETLRDHFADGPQTQTESGQWAPARPYGLYSLRWRVKQAWAVFTGRADALYWPGQQPRAY